MLLKHKTTGDLVFIGEKWSHEEMFESPFSVARELGVKIYALEGSGESKESEFIYPKKRNFKGESWEEYGKECLSSRHPGYKMKVLYRMFASMDVRYCGYTDDPWGYEADYVDWFYEPIFIFYKEEAHMEFIWRLLDAYEGTRCVYVCHHITRSIKTETVMARNLEEVFKELHLEDYEIVNDPRLQPRKPRFTGGIAEIVRRELLI